MYSIQVTDTTNKVKVHHLPPTENNIGNGLGYVHNMLIHTQNKHIQCTVHAHAGTCTGIEFI